MPGLFTFEITVSAPTSGEFFPRLEFSASFEDNQRNLQFFGILWEYLGWFVKYLGNFKCLKILFHMRKKIIITRYTRVIFKNKPY